MQRHQIVIVMLVQILMVVLLGVFGEYKQKAEYILLYPAFQDVHVMIFIGFGFLMVFLEKHSWSSVRLNFLIASWSLQATLIFRGMWDQIFHKEGERSEKIHLDLHSFGEADFGAGAILITFGAVLGKMTPFQLMIMSILELFFYTLNQAIAVYSIKITDVGGSMIIHLFGAVFGIFVTKAFSNEESGKSKNMIDGYYNNLIAAVGTIFLWMYWPSFNGLLAGDYAQRTYMNTILALCGSCTVVFFVSAWINKGKFRMEDILNATLAGGVIMGASANLSQNPGVALVIGIIGGFCSVIGFNFLTPWLWEKIGFHDTCGVTNLHAIPGFLGGIISCIVVAAMSDKEYKALIVGPHSVHNKGDRDQGEQALNQFYVLLITLAIASVSGFLVGKLLRVQYLFRGQIEVAQEMFHDRVHFHTRGTESFMSEVAEFTKLAMQYDFTKLGLADRRQTNLLGSENETPGNGAHQQSPQKDNKYLSATQIKQIVYEKYNELVKTDQDLQDIEGEHRQHESNKIEMAEFETNKKTNLLTQE